MLFDDRYSTISNNSEGIYRDKGSKFIAYAYPLNSESEVKNLVAILRTEHPKARHFCWAYRLGQDRNTFRINDDGEPSGTAGRPILNSLLSADLTNILVVVVRYFGGTLLGVPGLINAYKSATIEALGAAERIERTVNDRYLISFSYLHMNEVMRVIKDEQITVHAQNFNEDCELIIEIRKSKLNQILSRLEQIKKVKATYMNTL
ncbi:YigZ family protein [Pedobacter sp. MC2016-14]|uniref:IMPACT family protein n=1 Tax=Pedobacter sp. MC2016-14 TaxID=2897327 RepID=UPI001E53923B|nr:YigZ family protein [Pedobacter sp. MC2016-14]MCD0490004.1 YigZ family protein [Pedobacter sp. MC2016-14]